MWMIDPVMLCRNHLLGEANEIHKAYGSLLNHPHGEAIIEGHVEKGNIDTTLMEQRHDELAEEMGNRGFNHDSPFRYEHNTHYGEGCINIQVNKQDLANRCDDCRKRIDKYD